MTERTSVALGSFDGLHMGHLNVLQSALSSAEDGLLPYVLLFDAHPQKVLRGTTPPMLMTTAHRDRLLCEMGFRTMVVSFAEIHTMEPETFVRQVLVDSLHAGAVSCGYNYRFGKNGMGDAETLRTLCEKYNIALTVCDAVRFEGEPVSSTRIRKAIENGEMDKANEMLGRTFCYDGEVLHGNARGRQLGFPTINQALPQDFVVPKFGVYASNVTVDGTVYNGITNIGVRPTIDDAKIVCETNILDFSGDLYGRNLTVLLTKFVRPERKFANLEEVFEQVRKDIVTAFGE